MTRGARSCTSATSRLKYEKTPILNSSEHLPSSQIEFSKLTILHIEYNVFMDTKGWTFSLDLEDNHAVIMSSSKHIQSGMRGNNPKTVILVAEGLQASALLHIPKNKSAKLHGKRPTKLGYSCLHCWKESIQPLGGTKRKRHCCSDHDTNQLPRLCFRCNATI